MKRKLARRSLRALALLGILGFALSIESYRELLNTQAGEKTWCNFNEVTNCEKAFQSRYSHLFGRPISLYGAATYFLVASIAILGLVNGGPHLLASIFHLSLLGVVLVGGTFYFGWALFFKVKTVCVLCITDYLINLTTAAIAWRACWKLDLPYRSLLRWDLRSTFGTLALTLRTLIMVALFVVLGFIIVHQERRFYLKGRNIDLIFKGEVQPIATPWARAFPTTGPAEAPIKAVVFGDHQCPYCAIMKQIWEEILEEYPGMVRMTAIPSPTNSDCNPLALDNQHHPFSCQTAYLADEVYRRFGNEAYWEVQKELFKWGPAMNEEDFRIIALNAGIAEEEIPDLVAKSKSPKPFELANQTGVVVGVGSLPYTLLNGYRISGYIQKWAVLRVIEFLLEQQGLTLKDFRK
jgi:uncharacterized membrane protein/predicted DsbA family dithiol-disulfide isomerase